MTRPPRDHDPVREAIEEIVFDVVGGMRSPEDLWGAEEIAAVRNVCTKIIRRFGAPIPADLEDLILEAAWYYERPLAAPFAEHMAALIGGTPKKDEK